LLPEREFVSYQTTPRVIRYAGNTGTEWNEPIRGNYVLEVNKKRFINANHCTDVASSSSLTTDNQQLIIPDSLVVQPTDSESV
jgi:hypothetical protein